MAGLEIALPKLASLVSVCRSSAWRRGSRAFPEDNKNQEAVEIGFAHICKLIIRFFEGCPCLLLRLLSFNFTSSSAAKASQPSGKTGGAADPQEKRERENEIAPKSQPEEGNTQGAFWCDVETVMQKEANMYD